MTNKIIDVWALAITLMKEDNNINESTARYRASKIARLACCEKARSTHCLYTSQFECPDHGTNQQGKFD